MLWYVAIHKNPNMGKNYFLYKFINQGTCRNYFNFHFVNWGIKDIQGLLIQSFLFIKITPFL